MAELFTAAADNNVNGKNHDEAIKVQILFAMVLSSPKFMTMTHNVCQFYIASSILHKKDLSAILLHLFYTYVNCCFFILLLQILAHVSPKPAIKPSEEEYADAAPANFVPPVFGNHISFLCEETFALNDPEVLFSSLGCLYSLV